LAGAPHERQGLADEHHPRLRIAAPEHELGRGGAQRAAFEAVDDRAQVVERGRGGCRLARRHHRGVG
jgi:hypothetical protein